ncbi:hypothetical protein J3E69DRAFT_325695 [Trichoderma sp. SZMC 28015]
MIGWLTNCLKSFFSRWLLLFPFFSFLLLFCIGGQSDALGCCSVSRCLGSCSVVPDIFQHKKRPASAQGLAHHEICDKIDLRYTTMRFCNRSCD